MSFPYFFIQFLFDPFPISACLFLLSLLNALFSHVPVLYLSASLLAYKFSFFRFVGSVSTEIGDHMEQIKEASVMEPQGNVSCRDCLRKRKDYDKFEMDYDKPRDSVSHHQLLTKIEKKMKKRGKQKKAKRQRVIQGRS